jgi:hypothetical protein
MIGDGIKGAAWTEGFSNQGGDADALADKLS